ncbi:unnamed protein product [Caenorhabditis nigoni]
MFAFYFKQLRQQQNPEAVSSSDNSNSDEESRKSSSRNQRLGKRISPTLMTSSSLTEPVEGRPREKATFCL